VGRASSDGQATGGLPSNTFCQRVNEVSTARLSGGGPSATLGWGEFFIAAESEMAAALVAQICSVAIPIGARADADDQMDAALELPRAAMV
jgi:hypothetical protein